MNITIKETGEKKTLSIKGLTTTKDHAYQFIDENIFIDDWSKDKDGSFILKQIEYDLWTRILAMEERSLMLMREHASLMTDDVYKEIWHTKTTGLEHFTQVRLDIIERVTTGKITAKTVGIRSNGQARIGKATTITNCYEEDDKYFVDCEGTFILNTKRNRYEIPVGTSATHIIGSNCVTLDGELDCPIRLSKDQSRVVYDVLFNAIRSELADNGCAGLVEYNLNEDQELSQKV